MILPLFLLVAHFIGDFLLQNDWMALNKSKDLPPLVAHVAVYTATIVASVAFMLFWVVGFDPATFALAMRPELFDFPNKLISFTFLTFGTHLLVDAFTSRVNAQLWFFEPASKEFGENAYTTGSFRPIPGLRHWFFVAIGFDQLLHFTTLAWSFQLVFGK